ncbi:MAG: Glucodextranase, domain [Candidatus Parcubacteria bacterium]|jgi:hypothetical protein
MLEHNDIRKKIELGIIGLLLLTAFVYGIFRAYPLFIGPSITIYNPKDGDTVASTTFELSGEVSKVKEITVQGRPIPIDTEGHFREILVANPPYTILVITATDFYGSTVTKTLRVIPQ